MRSGRASRIAFSLAGRSSGLHDHRNPARRADAQAPRYPPTVLVSGHPRPEGGAKLTKSEFIDQVADRSGLSKKDAAEAVDAVLATVEDALKRGSEVVFSGFGKFSVSERGAREGR